MANLVKNEDVEIRKRVADIIEDKLGLAEEQIKDESRFIEDLGVDSLDLIELQMACEREFDINIQDEEIETVRTVAEIVNLVRLKIRQM